MPSVHDSDDFFAIIGHEPIEPVPPLKETSRSDTDHPTCSIVMTDHLYNPDIADSTTSGYVCPLIYLEPANPGELEIIETSMVSQSASGSSISFLPNEFDVPSIPKVETSFAGGAFDFNDVILNNPLPHCDDGWGNTLQSTSDPQSAQSVFTSTLMSPPVISGRDWFTPSPEIPLTGFNSKIDLLWTLPASTGIGLNYTLPNPLRTPIDALEFYMAEDGITAHSSFPLQQARNPSMYELFGSNSSPTYTIAMPPQLQQPLVFPAPITSVSNTPHIRNSSDITSLDGTDIEPIVNPQAQIAFDTVDIHFNDNFFQFQLPDGFGTQTQIMETEHSFVRRQSDEYTMSSRIKRKRTNVKPPKGNNQHGRTGTLACEQCRNRKWKCVYICEWLPCEFCRSRKIRCICLKIRGRKTAPRLSPSRPIPTAVDAVITAEEGLLLTFAYSNPTRFGCLNALFKILRAEYGPSISDSSLRHAVLARTARGLPPTERSKISDDHKQQATQALARKFETKTPLNDAEILSTCILALVERECCLEVSHCLDIFYKCTLLLISITDNGSHEPLLLVFRPYLLDWIGGLYLVLCTLRPAISHWHVPPSSTYSQHVRYYDALCRFEPALQVQLSAIRATFKCLNDLSERLVCCVHRATLRKVHGAEPSIDDKIAAALRDIRVYLGNLERERKSQREAVQIEDALLATQIAQFERQKLNGIHLALSLFEAPSILEGLSAARTRSIGSRLISSLQTLTPNAAPLNQHFNSSLYNAQLLISGMTLHSQEVPEFRLWVEEELGIEKSEEWKALELFWQERTMVSVVKVLDEILEEWLFW